MRYYNKLMSAALVALSLTLSTSCSNDDEPATNPDEWELSWSDEFNTPTPDNKPDPEKWAYEIGDNYANNQELQYYTDREENASYTTYKGLGCLKITAKKESYGGMAYTSARLKTAGLFEQKYGRFEARMQLPYGPGMWPAFWLLGANYDQVGWPECGEIDIMENKGWQPNIVSSALHFPGRSGGNPITQTFGYDNMRFDNDFHVFAVEWDEKEIKFFVDDHLYKTVSATENTGGKWVFDHPFYIILNLAVGGTFGGNPTDDTVFPQNLYIDYVRVYRKKGSPAQQTKPTGNINTQGSIDGWDPNKPGSDKGTVEPGLQ